MKLLHQMRRQAQTPDLAISPAPLKRSTCALAILLLCSLTLSGCGSLLSSDEPAASEWWLEPSTPTAPAQSLPYSLVVHLEVVPGLDSDRVLSLNQAGRLNAYAGAYWSDRLPDVLGSLVSRSLTDLTSGTVRQGDRAGSDECLLHIEVEEFFGRLNSEDSTDQVVVSYNGLLTCPELQRKLNGESTVQINSNRLSLIVSGFQDATDESVQSIAGQLTTP